MNLMQKRPLNIALCDNEKLVINEIMILCENVLVHQGLDYKIESYLSGDELLISKKKFDIIYLDIEMPGRDGFKTAEELRKRKCEAEIIFLTNHEERVWEAFKVRAFRYLLKPCSETEFTENMLAAINEIFKRKLIIIEEQGINKYVDIKKIEYLESLGDETSIVIGSEIIMSKQTLKYWEEILGRTFIRCHKSYLVNYYAVSEIMEGNFVLKSKRKIPVSVRRRKAARQGMYDFIHEFARYF